VLQLPPLRARQDRRHLVETLFHEEAASMGSRARLSEAAMQRLLAHGWPGNLRELRNVLRRALALCAGDRVDVDELQLPALAADAPHAAPTQAATGAGPDAMQLVELLRRHRWHVAKAAAELGVCRATVYRHMKRHAIVPPSRL
jgi:transcriptional regulator of acetoin/glycerol metabolism